MHFNLKTETISQQLRYLLKTATPLLILQFAASVTRGDIDSSQHFVVESTSATTYSQLGSPAVNGGGDIAFRGVLVDNSRRVMADIWDGSSASYASLFVQGGTGTTTVVTPFPDINDARTVAFSRTDTGELGAVRRRVYDPVAKAYAAASEAVAEWDQITPYTKPFHISSVYVALANNGQIAFPNTATGVFGSYDAIFSADSFTSTPSDAEVIDQSSFGISSLDKYVDVSNSGWVVRGSNALGQLGIFRVTTRGSSDRVTPAGDFSALGSRPSINDLGTIAFSGTNTAGVAGVYLNYSGSNTLINTTLLGTRPMSVINTVDKVAINKYNQVAYLGTDANGQTAIFSNNLGATRKIAAVGDSLNGELITGLRFHDGLMTSGDLVYMASTVSGQYIVRTNRAYDQTKLNDFPGTAASVVPWASQKYLLKATGEVPDDPNPKKNFISGVGCNLTTTANALSYYASDVTPLALQNWLLTAPNKSNYIDAKNNDFKEGFVEAFTRERFNAGLTDTIVTSSPYIPSGVPGDNRMHLIQALRGGQAVKLRVPSGTGANYQKFGHYVLAYGLTDSTKAEANLTNDDILIQDPGHGGVYSLGDYERKFSYNVSHPTWLDDAKDGKGISRQRLRIYTGSKGNGPLPATLDVSVFSPVDVVMTDASGRRVGYDDSLGVLNEIPGSQYWHDETYFTLDDELGDSLTPAWAPDEVVKHLYLGSPSGGSYSFDLTGTGDGPFKIDFSTTGNMQVSMSSISGVVSTGQHLHYTVTFSSSIPGDFNNDGIVNAADYVYWRKNDGTSAGYNNWRSNFGGPLGTGAGIENIQAVAEPASLEAAALVAFACVVGHSYRAQRSSAGNCRGSARARLRGDKVVVS